MRRQYIHRLGAGDARHLFHRQRLQPCLGISGDVGLAPRRIERADKQRTLVGALQGRRVRPGNAQDDTGVLQRRGAAGDGSTGSLIIRIADPAFSPAPDSTATSAPKAMNFFTVSEWQQRGFRRPLH
jgi:hypothetical protein